MFPLAWYQLLTMRFLTLPPKDVWLRSLDSTAVSLHCLPKSIFTDLFKIDFGGSPSPDIVGTTNRNFAEWGNGSESYKLSSFLSQALPTRALCRKC